MRPLLALALIGCAAGQPRSAPTIATTPLVATGLLACAPAGADALIEVDVARLRANRLVGPLLRLVPIPAGIDLDHADHVLAVATRIGEADAATIIWVRGDKLDARRIAAETADAQAIDDHTLALGPASHRSCAGGPDDELMRLRERAVPEGAPGSSVRIVARLSDRARVQLARLYGLSEFPREVSLWGDVADDAAMVAFLDRGAEMIGDRLRSLGVGDVRVSGTRLTWVVGPGELERRARELAKHE